MGATLISIIKVGGLTVIIGQAMKVIDKKEFKALIDFCGVTTVGLLIIEAVVKFFNGSNPQHSVQFLEKVFGCFKDFYNFVMVK